MSEIPSSWNQVGFGEINRFISRTLNPANTPDERFELYSVPSFPSGQPELQIGSAIGSTKQLVQPSDVLVCKINPRINRVWEVMQDQGLRQIASSEWIVMRAPDLESRFLRYFFSCPKFRELICKDVTGVGGSLTRAQPKRVATFAVPVAPKNEQKRIADKLDAVVARVDACRKPLDRVPAILKRFRQSVLAAATTGKLTEEWRGSSSDVTAWEFGKLETLLEGLPRNGYSPRAVEYETRVKTLTLTATTSGRFLPEHFKYIDKEIPQSSHLWLQPGDILIQRANSIEYVGVSAIYDGPPSGFIYPDLMMKCRANQQVHTSFLHYLLLSEPVRRYFRENATGTAGNMPKINQRTVASAPVSWPSRKEQTEIVRRVEALFDYADNLETRYTIARKQVERLTPALLAKAFRGELVPQNPNDEPASVLLERIRAARETTPTKSKYVAIGRGTKMTKVTTQSVKDLIRQLPDDRFTFDELRTRASTDYETLKEIVFDLLSESQPTVKQVFDTKAKAMRFIRVN